MDNRNINIPQERLEEFCLRWKIIEFALFGSVVRDDFGKESDIDVLVTFSKNAQWTLFDHAQMQYELTKIFNRNVDLVSRNGIERSRNHIRRKAILESAELIYAI